MAAAVHSVADNHPHVVLVDPPYQEVPEVPVDQVVLVQEDTEDQVPVVVVPAVAVVPVEAVQVAAEQDAEPDTDLAEEGNVPVAVEQPKVPAEADQAALAASQEDNPVEVSVEEWPVEEDPAEVESLAAEQVQAVMISEVHQEE